MPLTSSIGYIGVAKQSVEGTAVAPTDFFRWDTMSATPRMTIKPYNASETRDVAFTAKVGQWVEGKFRTYLYPQESSKLLCYTISATDAVSGAADPWTHVGSSASAQPVFLSFEWSQGNGQDIVRCTDCFVNQFDITGNAGELAMVDVGWIGRIATPGGTPATVSFSADRPLLFTDGTPTFGALNVTGSFVSKLAIHIKQMVEQIQIYGTIAPKLLAGHRDVTVDFELIAGATAPWRDINFGGDAATTAASTPFLISSIVQNWDIAGTPDHNFQITLNNIDASKAEAGHNKEGTVFRLAGSGQAKLVGSTALVQYSAKSTVAAAY